MLDAWAILDAKRKGWPDAPCFKTISTMHRLEAAFRTYSYEEKGIAYAITKGRGV